MFNKPRLITIALLCGVFLNDSLQADRPALDAKWKLIWQDEFDGLDFNQSNWSRVKQGNADNASRIIIVSWRQTKSKSVRHSAVICRT